jgi:hypothetical protein
MSKKTDAEKLAADLREAADLMERARADNEETKRLVAATRKLIESTKRILERDSRIHNR